MEILAFISFAALVLVWLVAPSTRTRSPCRTRDRQGRLGIAPHLHRVRGRRKAASRRTIRITTEYDGGAPDERGAESADGRRPQNLI